MIEDPWKLINPNVVDGTINGRRVDAKLPWSIFWALSSDNRCLIVFRNRLAISLHAKAPKLKSIAVTSGVPDAHGNSVLILKLLDNSHRDLFLRLCLDVVGATSSAKTESEAINKFLSRTWRWHHLLKGGGDHRLSLEEQKGLLGELFVIEELLLSSLKPSDAIAAWTGPTGAPKDFEIGRLCIEAKGRRGTATPYISISSEHQLDTVSIDHLYLHVVDLQSAPPDTPEALSITDVAKKLHAHIADLDGLAAEHFDRLLTSCGFRWEDDYTDSQWIGGKRQTYEVRDGFPRICPANFPTGISNVRYALSLKDCEPYAVTSAALINQLRKGNHGPRT